MNSSKIYEYLCQWLAETMQAEYTTWEIKGKKGNNLKGYGMIHSRRFPASENVLMSLVRNAVCYGKKRLFLFSEDGQTMYVFTGETFTPIEGRPNMFLKELIRRTFINLRIGIVYQTDTASIIARECIETLTSSDEYLYTPSRRYIAFTNGILDLEDKRLKAFNIRYQPYIMLDIPYGTIHGITSEFDKKYGLKREDNPARRWEWKIKEIIPNDDMRDAFQMFCGSLLLDREVCKFEYCCYLIGTGANGKSVLASAIAGVFGEQYFSRFTPKQLFKDSDARVNIAALQGKIANLVGDLDKADFAGGDFKRFASGEKFQGRRNYKDPIQVVAPPLLCCTNAMPESSDDSWGHHRRQLPIYTTTHQFTEEDKDPYLTQKLTSDESRSYIFAWIMEGYQKIISNGGNIKLGEDVLAAQRELRSNSNSARRWFRDYGYEAVEKPRDRDERWRSVKDLYEEYVAYSNHCGYASPVKRHELTNMLKSNGVISCRKSDGYYYLLDKHIDLAIPRQGHEE